MPVHHDEDFPTALAVLIGGMVAPALVAAVARDFLSLYVTARQFVLVAAVVFALVAWALLERLDLDRTTFLLVSIVWPWPVLFAILFVVLLLNHGEQLATGPVADVFRYLTGRSVASFLGYGGLFMLAGVGAVALSKQVEALGERDGRVPEARVVLAAIGLAVVLVGLGVAGVNHVTASAAGVSAVEPGIDQHRPVLNVTVEGRPAELRVTAVAPDGTSATRRLSRAAMRDGTETVGFEVGLASWRALPAQSGTYRVTVTTLAGVPVDEAEYRLDAAPTASISNVVVGRGELDREQLPERIGERVPSHETKVGVAVENPSEFPAAVRIGIHAPGTYATSLDTGLEPGERMAVILSIPRDDVSAIHDEHGGVVTVEVSQDGRTVATESVDLPQA